MRSLLLASILVLMVVGGMCVAQTASQPAQPAAQTKYGPTNWATAPCECPAPCNQQQAGGYAACQKFHAQLQASQQRAAQAPQAQTTQGQAAQAQAAQAAQMQAQIQAAQARLAQLQAQAAQMQTTQPTAGAQPQAQAARATQMQGAAQQAYQPSAQAGQGPAKSGKFDLGMLSSYIKQATDTKQQLVDAANTIVPKSSNPKKPGQAHADATTADSRPTQEETNQMTAAYASTEDPAGGPPRVQAGAGGKPTVTLTFDELRELLQQNPCAASAAGNPK